MGQIKLSQDFTQLMYRVENHGFCDRVGGITSEYPTPNRHKSEMFTWTGSQVNDVIRLRKLQDTS